MDDEEFNPETDETEFCWNSRRYCIFMHHFPQTCPHEKSQGKYCNPEDCGYCKMQKLSMYAKNKLKILQGDSWGENE